MAITKSEVYKNIIKITKETGQGLTGIIKVESFEYAKYIDELISDGLVKACHTGNSIGHPESNIFYMPTKGYNVWEDDGIDDFKSNHKGRYLHFVRLYLGLVKKESTGILEPNLSDYLQNPEIMSEYSIWLNRNHIALKEMINLDEDLTIEEGKIDEKTGLFLDDIEWIKEKSWYKSNLTIKTCLEKSEEVLSARIKEISINQQLLSLYRTKPHVYSNEIEEVKKEIKEEQLLNERRIRINKWLGKQNKRTKIKVLI